MAPHSSTLARKISWTEEPGGRQSMGLLRVRHDWMTSLSFYLHALEKEMPTHSSVLALRIPGTGEPARLPSMGSHRVGHDWNDLPAAVAARPSPPAADCSKVSNPVALPDFLKLHMCLFTLCSLLKLYFPLISSHQKLKLNYHEDCFLPCSPWHLQCLEQSLTQCEQVRF